MFSLPKLLVLALIVALVWYGFKWVTRVNRMRGGGAVDDQGPDAAKPAVEEMAKCSLCGTFVPAEGARHCGREDCPYPR